MYVRVLFQFKSWFFGFLVIREFWVEKRRKNITTRDGSVTGKTFLILANEI